MTELTITQSITATIMDGLKKAIESRDKDTTYQYLVFFRDVLKDSLQYRNIDHFRTYILFPSVFYREIAWKQKENAAYKTLVPLISDQLALHLREVIQYYIPFWARSVSTLDEKVALNKFYYETFRSFNNYFYVLTRHGDWDQLINAMNDYQQLGEGTFQYSMRDVLALKALIKKNDDGKLDNEIRDRNALLEIGRKYETYKRQVLTVLKYWLYLLFDNDVIDRENLLKVLVAIDPHPDTGTNNTHPDTDIEDVLFLRETDLKNYMNWEDWDFEDHPSGKTYYPPMPVNWITRGLLIDTLRTHSDPISWYPGTGSGDFLRRVPFLHDALVTDITWLKANISKWGTLLNINTDIEVDNRSAELLSAVALVTRSVLGTKERTVANLPLNQPLIEEFRKNAGLAWQKAARIKRVFDYFNNKQDVSKKDIKLKRVGPNTFLERGKINFIEGEHHSPIHGIADFGAHSSRWEDDLFMEVAFTSDAQIIEGPTLLNTVSNCLADLLSKKIKPTAILLEPEFVYKDQEFTNSERYESTYPAALNPNNLNFFVLGTFDTIPLYTSHSQKLKNKIIVSDFAGAFEKLYKTNNEWFDNQLSVTVNTVSDDLAAQKYSKNPAKWTSTETGQNLSEEEALVLIKTSVVIDVETIVDFRIKDSSKFNIGIITKPIAD